MKFRNQFFKYRMNQEIGGEGGGGAGGGADEGGTGGSGDDNTGTGDGNGEQNTGGDIGGNNSGFELSAEQMLDYRTQYSDDDGNIDIDKIISELHQGKNQSDAPEAYDNEFIKSVEELADYDVPVDDPLIQSAMVWAKENGVPQDKYQDLIVGAMTQLKDMQSQQAVANDTQMKESWAKIEDAEARQGKLGNQLSNMFGEDFKDDIGNLIKHPTGFLILERLAASTRDPQINTGSEHQQVQSISRDMIQSLRVERDQAEKSGDKGKVRTIEAKISKAYEKLNEMGKL